MSKVRDFFQLARHLTFRRVTNLFALRLSYHYSKSFRKSTVWGQPLSVSIEPTTACNLACPECPSGLKQFTRATGKLDLQKNEQLLEQLKKSVFYITYYFQGEPFLHPQFLELIKAAKKRRIYTATSTNAHFINEKKAEEIVLSGLDRLIISIDGASQQTYENYRIHGKLEKVLEASRHLVQAKKKLKSHTPYLIFQFLVVKPNEQDIPKIYELAREIGIDEVRLKSAQVYDYKNGNPLIPENEKYARYKKKSDGTYEFKYKLSNNCWRMWSSCVFTWDLKIVPCCFDKDARHILGDTSDAPFSVLWKEERYNQFRKAVLQNRSQIEICKNCSEGAKVWV
ncbi:MAG: radical SAM protein [Flavobacteriia bacterium]|mgnify:CR=1 FL=1|nr:radical SAM protein [Flavobacteriia bacterium]OJX36874.1 MAG: radical SAM protein [Flavobacteriia bacterium 40-80]